MSTYCLSGGPDGAKNPNNPNVVNNLADASLTASRTAAKATLTELRAQASGDDD